MPRTTRTKPARKRSDTSPWATLTWDDLTHWAGTRSVGRGRRYQEQARVRDLGRTLDDRLLATVAGGDHYTVTVRLIDVSDDEEGDRLESRCTCPVGYNGCKHAVAVVAEYLKRLVEGEKVDTVDADDERWAEPADLDEDPDSDRLDDHDHFEETNESTDNPFFADQNSKHGRRSKKNSSADWDQKIERHIREKSHGELTELVCSLTKRFPELRDEFRERISLSEGDVDRLVREARREIRKRTAETGWRNSWDGEGFTPEHSKTRHRFERLLELGHADAVVELGREFIELGMAQIANSHDEGETCLAVGECLPPVFEAVSRSTLSGPDRILFAIDAFLLDDYDVINDVADVVLDADYSEADWSEVADRLAARLNSMPTDDESDYHSDYARGRISGWIGDALEKAGRGSELRSLYESEARANNNYVRLVRYLIVEGHHEDAERWACEGIERNRDRLRGIASQLAGLLCEMARSRKQWDVVAAHVACGFFARPSTTGFDELIKAARKARCLTKVRNVALEFLESGTLPVQRLGKQNRKSSRAPKKTKKTAGGRRRTVASFSTDERPEVLLAKTTNDWPLPVPDWMVPLLPEQKHARPHPDVLLEMAIADNRPDDVLHWYRVLKPTRQRLTLRGYGPSGYSDRVAAAVGKTHPEESLTIYVATLENELGPADPRAYAAVAETLKKMRPILKKLKRETEWHKLVADIRERFKRRRLLLEALDRVEGRTIMETQKTRGKP